MATIDERPVFVLANTEKEGPILMVGVPKACWLDMLNNKKGKDIDLSRVTGLPIKLIIFAGADHDACMRVITRMAQENNVPILDERRKDFGIESLKDKEN